MTAGKLNSNLVWLFGLGAIVLAIGGGYATAGMGIKVSSGVFLGIYAIAGFLAAYLTEASKGKAILAFVTASVATAAIYYVLVSQVISHAAEGAKNGGTVGSVFGAFAAVIVLAETLAAGIGGVVVASKAKAQLAGGGR